MKIITQKFVMCMSLVLICLCFCVGFAGGCKDKKGSVSEKPQMVFGTQIHHFGRINDVTVKTCQFDFKNTGNSVLTIFRVKKTCGCTEVKLKKNEYLPGETGTIQMTFSGKDMRGKQHKQLLVESNDPDNPIIMLKFTAEVIPVVDIQPQLFRLGLVPYKQGVFEEATITGRMKDFAIKSVTADNPMLVVSTTKIRTVDSGGKFIHQATVKIAIEPNTQIGLIRGSVIIHIVGEVERILRLPVLAEVVGDIEVTPNRLYITQYESGMPFEQSIHLASRSDRTFRILDIALANLSQLELAPNDDIENKIASKSRDVLLSGKVGGERGTIRDTLIITTDIEGEETIKIPVHGFVKILK